MKKLSLISAAAVGIASFFMLTGFDRSVSTDELLRRYAQSFKDTEYATVAPSLELGFSAVLPSADQSGSETNCPFTVKADGEIELDRTNGFAMHADGSAEINLLNMILPYKGDAYVVPEDESGLLIFAGYDEGRGMNWQVLPAEVPDTFMAKLAGGDAFVLDTFPVDFTLDAEPVDVNGVSCYALRSQIDWQGFKALVFDAAAKVGDDENGSLEIPAAAEALADQAFGGILLDVELDLSEENCLAQRFTIKANENADWTAIGRLFASYLSIAGDTVNVKVADTVFDLEITFDYDTPVSVDVPDEVVTAVTQPAE